MVNQDAGLHEMKWKTFYHRLSTALEWDFDLQANLVAVGRNVAKHSAENLGRYPTGPLAENNRRNLYALGYFQWIPESFQGEDGVPAFSSTAGSRATELQS